MREPKSLVLPLHYRVNAEASITNNPVRARGNFQKKRLLLFHDDDGGIGVELVGFVLVYASAGVVVARVGQGGALVGGG